MCKGVTDPCSIQNPYAENCHEKAKCEKLPGDDTGDYYCQCTGNMVGDGYDTCIVVDQCGTVGCPDPNHKCEMDDCGEMKCPCKEGYMDNGFGGCTDTNECLIDKPVDDWPATTITVTETLERAPWDTARKFCKQIGKKLFTPDTEFKFNLLAPLANEDIWVGIKSFANPKIYKKEFRHTFRFLSETSDISETEGIVDGYDPHWKPGKPSASSDMVCVKLKKNMKKWENFHCRFIKRFYCEEPDGSLYDPSKGSCKNDG